MKTLALSATYSTFKYPVTLKPGLWVTQVIENYTTRSGTHDFLLTFHSNHRPISHRFRDKRQNPLKIYNFSHFPCIKRPHEGVPLGIWYRRKGSRMLLWWGRRHTKDYYLGLPDGRKSFKIGLVVLIQYRLWQTPRQTDRHVAVASTRYAIAPRLKTWIRTPLILLFCGDVMLNNFNLSSYSLYLRHWINLVALRWTFSSIQYPSPNKETR